MNASLVLFIDRMVTNCLRPYYTKGQLFCLALLLSSISTIVTLCCQRFMLLFIGCLALFMLLDVILLILGSRNA